MHDLAQEYLHSAELLAQRIRVLRAGLDALTGEPYFDALRRLELLRQEYYDTRGLGLFLLREYGKEVAAD